MKAAISAWRWMETAVQELGVSEIRGGENPRIMEFHREAATGQDEDEDAWCGAFMGWLFKEAGFKIPKAAGVARSWLSWGEQTPPRAGCVVVFWRGSPDGWQGHVGLLLATRGPNVYVLGGNQGDAVTVARMPLSQVLGYRWPTE